jgi:hypothetical protein
MVKRRGAGALCEMRPASELVFRGGPGIAAGCIGRADVYGLLDGAALQITTFEVTLGPDKWQYHRVGIPPNIEAPFSPDETAAGHDTQIEAALTALADLIPDAVAAGPPPALGLCGAGPCLV